MPQVAVRRSRQWPQTQVPGPSSARAISWDEAVKAFLSDKRAQNLSPSTLENYTGHLLGARANQFREDHGIDGPGDLTAEALSSFQAELLDAGVSPALAHAYHRVLKNFARFCLDRGYSQQVSVLTVKAPRLPQTEPETFTPLEAERLLRVAKTPRDEILIDFLLHTGVRLRELIALRVDDITEGEHGAFIRVRQGKGRKDRIVPLDTPQHQLSKELDKYITKIRPRNTKSPYLFLTNRKTDGGDVGQMSPRGVQIMLRRLSEETGIHVHPHKFRHTFATRALAAGVDVMALQRVLGHTTLSMVSRYVHYQSDDLVRAWMNRRD